MSTAVIVSDTTFFLFLDATQSLFRLLLLQSYMIFPKQTCSNLTKTCSNLTFLFLPTCSNRTYSILNVAETEHKTHKNIDIFLSKRKNGCFL